MKKPRPRWTGVWGVRSASGAGDQIFFYVIDKLKTKPGSRGAVTGAKLEGMDDGETL